MRHGTSSKPPNYRLNLTVRPVTARACARSAPSQFAAENNVMQTSKTVSVGIVLWFVAAGIAASFVPVIGYLMLVPVYVWVFFGKGAAVLKGSWPATFMMEDIETDRGVKVFFAVLCALQTALIALDLFR